MIQQPEDQLSPEAVAELSRDHLATDSPRDDGIPRSLADEEAASVETPLGGAVLAKAYEFLKMPLREDAGVNQDKNGYIRKFFLEGLKWSPDTWEHWAEKYPNSGVAKPEWCAAFASYCARMAYNDAGLKLPATLSASASELASRIGKASRLLAREDLFNTDGSLRDDVSPPGPGDLVVWHGHVGILKAIYPSGSYTTIEGNTWRGAKRNDGVYQCDRNSLEKKADGTFRLVGFCLLASVDGQSVQASKDVEPAPASSAKSETKPEPPYEF